MSDFLREILREFSTSAEGVAKRTLLECFSRYEADKTRPEESSELRDLPMSVFD